MLFRSERLPIEAAATVPVAFLTAWYSLLEVARLKRGEWVLIHGAAGGVGLAAMQIARWKGAKIVATARAEAEQEAVKADFWGRTASAIRATRSFSTLRYGTPAYAKWYAFEHITRVYNWDDKQFGCLVSLWTKESNWRYSAVSKNKKWYGIPQATKQVVTSLGLTVQDYMRAPELQVQAGARYINYRYGSPCAAWKHSSRKGWY